MQLLIIPTPLSPGLIIVRVGAVQIQKKIEKKKDDSEKDEDEDFDRGFYFAAFIEIIRTCKSKCMSCKHLNCVLYIRVTSNYSIFLQSEAEWPSTPQFLESIQCAVDRSIKNKTIDRLRPLHFAVKLLKGTLIHPYLASVRQADSGPEGKNPVMLTFFRERLIGMWNTLARIGHSYINFSILQRSSSRPRRSWSFRKRTMMGQNPIHDIIRCLNAVSDDDVWRQGLR